MAFLADPILIICLPRHSLTHWFCWVFTELTLAEDDVNSILDDDDECYFVILQKMLVTGGPPRRLVNCPLSRRSYHNFSAASPELPYHCDKAPIVEISLLSIILSLPYCFEWIKVDELEWTNSIGCESLHRLSFTALIHQLETWLGLGKHLFKNHSVYLGIALLEGRCPREGGGWMEAFAWMVSGTFVKSVALGE